MQILISGIKINLMIYDKIVEKLSKLKKGHRDI